MQEARATQRRGDLSSSEACIYVINPPSSRSECIPSGSARSLAGTLISPLPRRWDTQVHPLFAQHIPVLTRISLTASRCALDQLSPPYQLQVTVNADAAVRLHRSALMHMASRFDCTHARWSPPSYKSVTTVLLLATPEEDVPTRSSTLNSLTQDARLYSKLQAYSPATPACTESSYVL